MKPIYLTYDNTYQDAERILAEYRLQHPECDRVTIILIPQKMWKGGKDDLSNNTSAEAEDDSAR